MLHPRSLALGLSLLLGASVGLCAAAPPRSARKAPAAVNGTGEQVYRRLCASCHGAKGEGTKKYPKALTGTRSVGELGAFIAKSMPPGRKKCPAADARKAAAYIFDAFYSPLAQARNRPARVELSRLTVRQYRSAVTDLIGSFRGAPKSDQRHGLHGEYFKSARFGDRALERTDPEIHFDFGTATALKEQPDPYLFSMRWDGSVLAPDTGDYEFIVRSDQAVRLFVNDPRRALIDAMVKSGSDNEFRGSVFLLGGRAYTLKLEFSKGITGVNNPEKLKQKPVTAASLSLEWRPPHRPAEVIPQRSLSPVQQPEVFAAGTPFPPDDRSLGYERGTSVSRAWEEATTSGAIETAAYVSSRLRELAGGAGDAVKLREFCKQFAERAFRRPLTPDLQQVYVERQFQKAPDPETAVKRNVLLVLKSPRFLYRELDAGPGDAYDTASRLSFGLWDSLPDQELLKAAAAGELSNREQVVKQAERMVSDPRAWSKLRDFLLQWLKIDSSPEPAKDPKRYPGFDASVAADLRTSLELFLEQNAWEKSDFRELMLSDKVFLNGRLAKLYGVNMPPGAPFQPVALDSGERAGVLTQPFLLANFAYVDSSSPIHRGVLIVRSMLGRLLQPPPQAFAPLPADAHPNLTTRQRVEMQTKPAACAGCHNMINPLGFTLEKFDAVGRIRNMENNSPVDAHGSYVDRAGKLVKFSGARELAGYLAASEESRSAFVEKLFQNMVKQPVRAYGPNAVADLEKAFEANEFNIRRQMVETIAVAALHK